MQRVQQAPRSRRCDRIDCVVEVESQHHLGVVVGRHRAVPEDDRTLGFAPGTRDAGGELEVVGIRRTFDPMLGLSSPTVRRRRLATPTAFDLTARANEVIDAPPSIGEGCQDGDGALIAGAGRGGIGSGRIVGHGAVVPGCGPEHATTGGLLPVTLREPDGRQSRRTVMNARRFLSALSVLGLLATGCGGSDAAPPADGSEPPSIETTSYDDGPDTAVVRIGRPDQLPTVVIGGDGWAYFPSGETQVDAEPAGLVSAGGPVRVAPAPPVPTPVSRRQLTATGVDIVLARADRLDLLEEPDEYEAPQVTDSGSTFVSFDVDAGMFEHDAYALGAQDESGNRQRLLRFVEELADLEGLVGSENIGPAEPFTPERYVVTNRGNPYFADVDDSRVWPSDVDVVEGCVELPLDSFPGGAAGVWVEDPLDAASLIGVVPDLPGDSCV